MGGECEVAFSMMRARPVRKSRMYSAGHPAREYGSGADPIAYMSHAHLNSFSQASTHPGFPSSTGLVVFGNDQSFRSFDASHSISYFSCSDASAGSPKAPVSKPSQHALNFSKFSQLFNSIKSGWHFGSGNSSPLFQSRGQPAGSPVRLAAIASGSVHSTTSSGPISIAASYSSSVSTSSVVGSKLSLCWEPSAPGTD